jgi:hypothetical protein
MAPHALLRTLVHAAHDLRPRLSMCGHSAPPSSIYTPLPSPCHACDYAEDIAAPGSVRLLCSALPERRRAVSHHAGAAKLAQLRGERAPRRSLGADGRQPDPTRHVDSTSTEPTSSNTNQDRHAPHQLVHGLAHGGRLLARGYRLGGAEGARAAAAAARRGGLRGRGREGALRAERGRAVTFKLKQTRCTRPEDARSRPSARTRLKRSRAQAPRKQGALVAYCRRSTM